MVMATVLMAAAVVASLLAASVVVTTVVVVSVAHGSGLPFGVDRLSVLGVREGEVDEHPDVRVG